MPESSVHPLESILRLCAAAAPQPWYPSAYAKETNTTRDTLDPHLDQLRMVGLIRLTDWMPGLGQGYALTPTGEDILKSPRQLGRLAAGKWSPPAERNDKRLETTRSSPWERGEAVRNALLFPIPPIVTFSLMIINIVAFVLQTQVPQFRDLFVANPIGFLDNQWWRLLTTAFLHGGSLTWPWHLAMNMFALYSLGRVSEAIWGHGRFLAIYLVAAIGGSCLALLANPGGCIGASGAVCGIFGAWATWLFYNRQHLPPNLVRVWQMTFAINAILLIVISYVPGVSWAGHLGGAIAGLVSALCFLHFQPESGRPGWMQWAGVILVPVVGFGLLVRTMNTSPAWKELRELQERREMNQYLSRTNLLQDRVEKTYKNATVPLLAKPPSDRDPDQIIKVVDQLRQINVDLIDDLNLMHQRGSFATPFVERARELKLQALQAQIDFLESTARCLERGDQWTENDQLLLNRQGESLEESLRQWANHMKGESRN
jgi:membrane associated rhomboid family serine protease